MNAGHSESPAIRDVYVLWELASPRAILADRDRPNQINQHIQPINHEF